MLRRLFVLSILTLALVSLSVVNMQEVEADGTTIQEKIDKALEASPDNSAVISLSQDELHELLIERGFSPAEIDQKMNQPFDMMEQMKADEEESRVLQGQTVTTRTLNVCCYNGIEASYHVGTGAMEVDILQLCG